MAAFMAVQATWPKEARGTLDATNLAVHKILAQKFGVAGV
jgi:hypothetical protein